MVKRAAMVVVLLLTHLSVSSPARAGEAAARLPEQETLLYAIKWMGLPVGTLSASVKGITTIGGREVYILEAVGKTNAVVSAIYKIDGRFVSYMDAEKLYSVRFEAFRRDGRGNGDTVTTFDQKNHQAHIRNLTKKTHKTFPIPVRLQDVLSACYYLMLMPLAVGDQVPYDVYYDEENRHVRAVVESRITIRCPALGGPREALVIRPYARLQGGKIEKGNVRSVYSAQAPRVPVQAVIKGPIFGQATITLVKVRQRKS